MAIKKTSSLMNLGATLELVDGAAVAEVEMNLPLDSLSREIWVITDIQMDHDLLAADATPGGGQVIGVRATKNSKSTLVEINDPDCIGAMSAGLLQSSVPNLGGITYMSSKTPDFQSTGSTRDFLAIVATPNWFIQGAFTSTAGGASNKGVFVRIQGYRAQADLATYSALIAEELNS